jgi:hypothetical protein
MPMFAAGKINDKQEFKLFFQPKIPMYERQGNIFPCAPAFHIIDMGSAARADHSDEDNRPSGWQAARRPSGGGTILFCKSQFDFYELLDMSKQFCRLI